MSSGDRRDVLDRVQGQMVCGIAGSRGGESGRMQRARFGNQRGRLRNGDRPRTN